MPNLKEENGAKKNTFWMLGSLFTISLFMAGILVSGFVTTVNAISDRSQENARLTIKHEEQITGIKEIMEKMDSKLDVLLNQRFGFGSTDSI